MPLNPIPVLALPLTFKAQNGYSPYKFCLPPKDRILHPLSGSIHFKLPLTVPGLLATLDLAIWERQGPGVVESKPK